MPNQIQRKKMRDSNSATYIHLNLERKYFYPKIILTMSRRALRCTHIALISKTRSIFYKLTCKRTDEHTHSTCVIAHRIVFRINLLNEINLMPYKAVRAQVLSHTSHRIQHLSPFPSKSIAILNKIKSLARSNSLRNTYYAFAIVSRSIFARFYPRLHLWFDKWQESPSEW